MKKLLIIHGTMVPGGAETFLMKILRRIDRNKYMFDFYIMGEKGFYDDEIISLGGKITYGAMKTQGYKAYKRDLKSFFNKEKYDYIFRASSNAISLLDLYYAKKYSKAKVCVARSANANSQNNVLHYIFRHFLKNIPNVKLSPSTEAAIFMFGKKNIKRGKVNLINNGIDRTCFFFDEKIRLNKRKELEIGFDEKLFLNIASFKKQKNHVELILIFKQILNRDVNSRLLCVGAGKLKDDIMTLAKKEGVINKIIFLANIKDINSLLNAADVMLLPSFYEGLPNVIIEAQATGLPCVVSTKITRECKITDSVSFVELGNTGLWAEQAMKSSQVLPQQRNVISKSFPDSYDIINVTKFFLEHVFLDQL